MTILRFSSGLDAAQDLALTEPFRPDPAAVETMNFWAYDPVRDIGLNLHPRMQAGGMHVGVTAFLGDGTILRCRGEQGAFSVPNEPATCHVRYRCEEPFARWHYRVNGLPAFRTSDAKQRLGVVEDETPVAEIDCTLTAEAAAPVWRNGTLTAEARAMMAGPAGLWVAGRITSGLHPESFRYDQLVRVHGQFFGSDFDGVGLRSHVRGCRNLQGMAGTCWMSGLFPSGSGFGVLVNLATDGTTPYSEACVFDRGELLPACVLSFPRGHRDLDEGRFRVELVSDRLGPVTIDGEDLRAFYWSMPSWGAAATMPPRYGKDPEAGVLMKQALARYRLNGETGYGLNERSG